jgi:hypothetical protein
MITLRTAIAGIAAIVVLVFAGAGAGSLFSSNSTNSSRTIAFAGPGAAPQLALARGFGVHGPSAGSFFGSRGQSAGPGFGSQIRLRCASTRNSSTTTARCLGGCGRMQPQAGGGSASSRTLGSAASPRVTAVGPLVASLFGSSAHSATSTVTARAQDPIRLCATLAPMNRLPGAGSPGTGLAPQTSSSPPRG